MHCAGTVVSSRNSGIEHVVLGREGGERTFNHPTDGFLRYQQVTFNLAGQPDLRLTMLLRGAGDAD